MNRGRHDDVFRGSYYEPSMLSGKVPSHWQDDRHPWGMPGGDSLSRAPSGQGSADTQKIKKRKSLRRMCRRFAEKTSLQGVRYIEDAGRGYSRALWVLVFLAAIGMSVVQLQKVFEEYLSHPVTTSINLGYDTLNFPSVTICNINPFRWSKLHEFPPMEAYVRRLATHWDEEMDEDEYWRARKHLGGGPPKHDNGPGGPGHGGSSENHDQPRPCDPEQTDPPNPEPPRGPELTTEDPDPDLQVPTKQPEPDTKSQPKDPASSLPNDPGSSLPNDPGSGDDSKLPPPAPTMDPDGPGPGVEPPFRRKRSLFPVLDDNDTFDGDDDYKWDWSMESIVDEDESDERRYGGGDVSDDFKAKSRFTHILKDIDLETRKSMGHEKNMTILSCSFNGRKCSSKNFTTLLSTDYGNCYVFNDATIRTESLRSRNAGNKFGLSLILYSQTREYLKGLTDGRGFRLVVHPFGTLASPDYNSMAVAPGFGTDIGIRLINISRLGSPHGECADDGTYKQMYNYKYTATTCASTCTERFIARQCMCKRPQYIQHYPLSARVLRNCGKPDKMCVERIQKNIRDDSIDCGCVMPCKEEDYNYISSFYQWPTPEITANLIELVCKNDLVGDDCQHLYDEASGPHFDMGKFSNNFAHLRISYMELNYESIVESAAYSVELFVADIGGVVGLWLGMSILSALEVVDFLFQLCGAYCKPRRKNLPPTDHSTRRAHFGGNSAPSYYSHYSHPSFK